MTPEIISYGMIHPGGALTMAFVHPEGDEPTIVVADQDTNGNDQDYLELARGEHGGPGFSLSSSQEHTPINGTNRRVEEAVEVGKEYGGVGQAGFGVVLNGNDVLDGSVKG